MMKPQKKAFFDDGKPYPYHRFFIRLLDVGLLGIYFLFFSIIFAIGIEYVLIDIFGRTPKNTFLLVVEICLYASLIMIISYIIRNIIELIPFPFDKMYNYSHNRIGELKGGVIFAFAIIVFMKNFKNKLDILIHDHLKIMEHS